MAVANYHDTYGRFPPPYVPGPDGRPWHSWRVLLLPYIDQQELYAAYNFAEPWDGPNNRKLADRMPSLYMFHGSEHPKNTTTNYLAVVGDETVWPDSTPLGMLDVTDVSGETVLLIENRGANVHWMAPRDLALATVDLAINSPAGVSSPYDDPAVVMVDGSLHRLRPDLKPETLRALLTARGGERLAPAGKGSWDLLQDGRLRSRREP